MRLNSLLPSLLGILALSAVWTTPDALGQDIAPPTRTIAITGATVIPSPGQLVPNATVVIRDGLITAVGPAVAVPYDARVIKGDSLFVYAGFIDALSHAGLEAPRRTQGGGGFGGGGGNPGLEPVADRGNPPNDRAGIQPERDVRTLLKADDASVSKLRSAGFTAAHTVPYGQMLPGTGAVILLHGQSADDMEVLGEASLFAQFQAARGVYPGTPMGMTAKIRQMYRESERRLALERQYADDPEGLPRPPYDAAHAALFPVIDGDRTVFFYVGDALEAHRALRLREDLGFRMVLAGLGQGYDLADKLARSGVALAVTTSFPDKPGWMAGVKRDSLLQVMENYDPDYRAATWRDTEAEARNLEARQALAREDFVANAAKLSAAGASFAFTSLDTEAADIIPNIREMIAAGLDSVEALAALTTRAADLIGTSRSMGSVEPGKLGNLVLTDGPLFAEKSAIKHVLIEGQVYDIQPTGAAGRGGSAGPAGRGGSARSGGGSLAGTWSVEALAPDGQVFGTFEVSGTPGSYRAWLTYDGVPNSIAISSISVDGSAVSFGFVSPDGDIRISMTRDGDSMNGTATVNGADSVPVSMKRNPNRN